MLNIVIPMAGAGSRFALAGYADPKPLIPIHGTPMIQVVIDNLRPALPHRFIFICQRSHARDYGLESRLAEWAPGCVVRQLDEVTQGAACTVLTVKDVIDTSDPLMIANSDQFIDAPIEHYLRGMEKPRVDGLIMTMKADDPKWSYVSLGADGFVKRVAEKEVISEEATVGIYNFRYGDDFVRAAQAMIARDLSVNGEFYVAPVYNLLVEQGKRIAIHDVGSVGRGMHGLGTPDDLERFVRLPLSRQRASARP